MYNQIIDNFPMKQQKGSSQKHFCPSDDSDSIFYDDEVGVEPNFADPLPDVMDYMMNPRLEDSMPAIRNYSDQMESQNENQKDFQVLETRNSSKKSIAVFAEGHSDPPDDPQKSSYEESYKDKEPKKKKMKTMDKAQIKKDAKKNALQFFSSLACQFAQESNFILSFEAKQRLQYLKTHYSIPEFNALFQAEGELRCFFSQFFEPEGLWRRILSSKVRSYHYKLVYKEVGAILRKSFFKKQFNGLSSYTN